MDTVNASRSTPSPAPATGVLPSVDGVAMSASGDIVPVMLFEDAEGRMVVVDPRIPRDPRTAVPMLRIGRARLALHHLAPAVVDRLGSTGQVTVEGPDALNVLLAFADGVGLADPVD